MPKYSGLILEMEMFFKLININSFGNNFITGLLFSSKHVLLTLSDFLAINFKLTNRNDGQDYENEIQVAPRN